VDGTLLLEETLPRGEGLRISLLQTYRIVETDDPERGPLKVSTRAYTYTLEDADEREIVAFHWHPAGRSPVTRPHLHLGPGCGVEAAVSKVHFPTGRISVGDFLWTLIDGFDVPARRDDWQNVLDASRDVFEEWRTWS
jgi:hypothetical protein